MRKVLITAAVLFTIILISSCKNKIDSTNPESIPTNIYTYTETATVTFTNTATFTPTATSTPVLVVIDDFEDNDNIILIQCSDCINFIVGAYSDGVSGYIRGCYSLNGAPAYLGSFAYGITATVQDNGNAWFAIYISTKVSSSTGSNFSGYNKLKFYYKVSTNAPSSTNILTDVVLLYGNEKLRKNGIVLDKSNNWQQLSLNFNEFTVESVSKTMNEILSNVGSLNIYFRAQGNGTSNCRTEISIDNIIVTSQ